MGWSVLAPAGFDRMGIEFPTCRGVFPLVRGLPIVDFITTRYIGSIPAGTGVGGGVKWAASGCWAADGFRWHPGRMGHVVPEFLSFAIFSGWAPHLRQLKELELAGFSSARYET